MKFYKYLLIFTILLALFLVAPVGLSAQRDTTGTAARTDSIIEYLTPLEYAFMMHEETKFMLRVPAVGVGVEVEVLPYFTFMGQAQLNIAYSDYLFGLTGESRWYYGSKKKGVSNMSGNYIGGGYQHQSDLHSALKGSNSKQIYAKWGIQRRFLGAGLIDLGVNFGYKKLIYDYAGENEFFKDERIFLQTTGTIGLGIVFNNEKALDKDKLCPALKCYERETFLLKINTLNLLNVQYSDWYKRSSIWFIPQVGVEQKLFNSPFSIGANMKLNYNWSHSKSDKYYNGTNNYTSIGGRLQARYYYNLKNRILKGKSGNGFSANYISGGVYQMYDSNRNNPFKINDNEITLTTGIQRTFSKHLYFDVEVGVAFDKEWNFSPELYGEVQVGIKF